MEKTLTQISESSLIKLSNKYYDGKTGSLENYLIENNIVEILPVGVSQYTTFNRRGDLAVSLKIDFTIIGDKKYRLNEIDNLKNIVKESFKQFKSSHKRIFAENEIEFKLSFVKNSNSDITFYLNLAEGSCYHPQLLNDFIEIFEGYIFI